MPVIPSVMMMKVSEPSRATRAAAASGLSLQHGLRVTPESAAMLHAAPVTPSDASASSAKNVSMASSSPAAVFSPRDPSAKVAAVNPPSFSSKIAAPPSSGYGTPSNQVVSSISIKHPTIQPPAAPSTPRMADSAPSSPESSPVGKRGQAAVSTPKTSSSSASSPKSTKANTGRWTDAEHKLFLKGLEAFPYRAWKKIATLIKTRTVVQIRTHAQKYYQKLEKEEARMKDREHHHDRATHSHGYNDRSSHKESSLLSSSASSSSLCSHTSDASDYSDESSFTPKSSNSPAKKKTMLRKRKFTMDEDSPASGASTPVASAVTTLPSLPKRMMKEKKFPREKHMSPKQKAPVSGNKFFGSSFSSPEFGPETTPRAVFGRGNSAASKIPPHPLDFDDDATSEHMILDFADDKSIVEYPFHLDGSIDHGISSMDNDDLLQLTDEESLDWFSTTTSGNDHEELLKAEPLGLLTAESTEECAADTSDSSPLTLGRYHFSPLYTDECLQFSDESNGSSPSSVMLDSCDASDFILSGDEDDDFVLDPEKFLSSYFSPASIN
uniref:Uncharacterized protein n=1 Tax=Globisporangium ultimum (strain ATCC 200006 / CBS 805.95 / DAOM BR144) TaxID=431595 RepID=K3WUM8_GLOUD